MTTTMLWQHCGRINHVLAVSNSKAAVHKFPRVSVSRGTCPHIQLQGLPRRAICFPFIAATLAKPYFKLPQTVTLTNASHHSSTVTLSRSSSPMCFPLSNTKYAAGLPHETAKKIISGVKHDDEIRFSHCNVTEIVHKYIVRVFMFFLCINIKLNDLLIDLYVPI